MLVESLVIGLLHIGVGGKTEAHLVDAKSRPPLVTRTEAFCQNGQRLSFRLRRLRARISDIGGRACIARKGRLLAVFVGFYGEIFAREVQPSVRVLLVEERR